jgi:hypothetical protein
VAGDLADERGADDLLELSIHPLDLLDVRRPEGAGVRLDDALHLALIVLDRAKNA